jgi:cytoskeletal protein RodZ
MINRNNYEEYMLLYIDDELSSDERQAMEAFLLVNPDLKDELALLQQTILQSEQIEYSHKQTLYKKEEGINLSNYQEYFLLYVDEELHSNEREAVEKFVLQNPSLQQEFTLLKQTVLPKEWVIFQNKEVLYRKEEKRRPVIISLRWASLAAAVMVGLIAFVWILNTSNASAPDKTATAAKTQPNVQKNTVTANKVEETLPVESMEGTTLVAEQKDNNTKQPTSTKQVQQKENNVPEQLAVVPQQGPAQTTNQRPVIAGNTNDQTTTSPLASAGSPDNSSKRIVVSTPDMAGNNYVKQAVYTEELNTDEEKNKNVYVGSLEINTDKVRSFFRKAGRYLSNKVKNKDDDGDKIQVANLQVNKLK